MWRVRYLICLLSRRIGVGWAPWCGLNYGHSWVRFERAGRVARRRVIACSSSLRAVLRHSEGRA